MRTHILTFLLNITCPVSSPSSSSNSVDDDHNNNNSANADATEPLNGSELLADLNSDTDHDTDLDRLEACAAGMSVASVAPELSEPARADEQPCFSISNFLQLGQFSVRSTVSGFPIRLLGINGSGDVVTRSVSVK